MAKSATKYYRAQNICTECKKKKGIWKILFRLFTYFFFFEKVYNATYHSVGNFYNAYRCVTRIERSNL